MVIENKIIGQYTDIEFRAMCDKAGLLRYQVSYPNKTAWVRYGKYTINYYIQHTDGSWTNTHCHTKH
jgi:hypothetical protein